MGWNGKARGKATALDPVRQARIDLAAAHRLAVMHGFSEGICNHLTMTVPGATDHFFLIPYGLHWSEVSASSFMIVDYDGRTIEGDASRSAPPSASMRRSIASVPAFASSTPICPMRAPSRASMSRSCR